MKLGNLFTPFLRDVQSQKLASEDPLLSDSPLGSFIPPFAFSGVRCILVPLSAVANQGPGAGWGLKSVVEIMSSQVAVPSSSGSVWVWLLLKRVKKGP